MATYLNLTPLQDDTIVLKKGEVEISFPDRVPASLVPTIMGMQDDTGDIKLSDANISRLFKIVTRLILRANPEMTDDYVMDFLDLQDLLPIIQALLNPRTPSSVTTPENVTPMREARTRKRSK